MFGGFESVKVFANSRSDPRGEDRKPSPGRYDSSPFFQRERNRIGWKQDMIHPKVTSCYKHLRNYPRCRGSCFDDLVKMIERKLICLEDSKRYMAREVEGVFRGLQRRNSNLYSGTSPDAGFQRDARLLNRSV